MTDQTEQTVPTCYRHPDRITGLSCTTCGKSICAECSHDASVGQKCPECAAPEGRARVVHARQTMGRPSFQTAPVSFTIIAITAAVFVAGYLSPDIELLALKLFALVRPPGVILGGEILEPQAYRIFTVALVHGGLMHIGFNMYALYLFGPRLEQQVGGPAFGSLYLASAGGGGLLSMAFTTAGGISVGASGAIFGLFGAWIFVAWKMRGTPGGRAMFNQLLALMAINAVLPLLVPSIDWLGHLGGLAAGVLIAWLWSFLAVGRTNARTIRTAIALAVAIAAVLLALGI
ncbi:MAG: rhomboid family intramembrane serine protease [Actinomycetota bacterium]